MKKQIAIVIILLLGIAVNVFLSQRQQILKSRASLQAYSAFNVGSGEPGKYVKCEGNVCETNTLNITISVRDLQALNIQEQQVASQCSWQPQPIRCTGCGVGSILEQDSCTQEIKVTADGVQTEECNLPEWCGSYVTQNTTERPPEQFPQPPASPQGEQGEPQQVCEEKSYCDDNLGLRVFRNTCQKTPVREEFDPQCVPVEHLALNLQLQQEVQPAPSPEPTPEPPTPQNFWQNIPIINTGINNAIAVAKIFNSMLIDAQQKSQQQFQQEQNLPDECKNTREDYLSSECRALIANIPTDNRSPNEKAADAEIKALETGNTKESLKKLNVDLEIKEEKLNIGLCLNPLICPTIDFFVPQDSRNTVAAVILKRQTEELAKALDLDLSTDPNQWDSAKREYFFKAVANGDINVAKALTEFFVPVSAMEKVQFAKQICEKNYGGNCLSSSDNILSIANLNDQDIDQANQWLKEQNSNFAPANANLVREFVRVVYGDPEISTAFTDPYLSEVAKNKLNQQIAQKLNISLEQLTDVQKTFQEYGQYGDFIRSNTSAGKLLQEKQNELAVEGAIAAATSIPAADLAVEGLVFGVRKVTPKLLSVLVHDYGDDLAKKIVKDVEDVAERGGKNMTAVEAASVRKAEAALAESLGDDLALATTPAGSLDNLVRGGGLDNDAAAAFRTIRDDPKLDETAAKGLEQARSGTNSLDNTVVVIIDPDDAKFVAPEGSRNPWEAMQDGIDDLIPGKTEPKLASTLDDVAGSLDGAEARLLGGSQPDPNPALEIANRAVEGAKDLADNVGQALGITPKELLVIKSPDEVFKLAQQLNPRADFAHGVYTEVHIGPDGKLYIIPEMIDTSRHWAGTSGYHSMLEIKDLYGANQTMKELVGSLPFDSTTIVAKGTLQKTPAGELVFNLEYGFRAGTYLKLKKGEVSAKPETLFYEDLTRVKENLGISKVVDKTSKQEINLVVRPQDVPAIYPRGELMFHSLVKPGSNPDVVSGFARPVVSLTKFETETIESGVTIVTPKRIIEISLKISEAPTQTHQEAVKALIPQADARLLEDLLTGAFSGRGLYNLVQARHTIDRTNKLIQINLMVEGLKGIDDIAKLADYEYGFFSSYLSQLLKHRQGMEEFQVALITSYKQEDGKIFFRRTSFGLDTLPQEQEMAEKILFEKVTTRSMPQFPPLTGGSSLAPCPVKFGFVGEVLAQGGESLNPCPKNPFAALARNAGNVGRQVGNTVGGTWNGFINGAVDLVTEGTLGWVQKTKPRFNIYQELSGRKGPLVELAGPTDEGFKMVNVYKREDKFYVAQADGIQRGTDKELITSNLRAEGVSITLPGCDPYNYGPVSFQADASRVPLKNSSVGAIFISCLPRNVRQDTIKQSHGALEDGGLLIWQGGVREDIEAAEKTGFQVVSLVRYEGKFPGGIKSDVYHVVFQKATSGGLEVEQVLGKTPLQTVKNAVSGWVDNFKGVFKREGKEEVIKIEGQNVVPQVNELANAIRASGNNPANLNGVMHQEVNFSQYGEHVANFVRFRARVKDKLVLGTTHENTLEERLLIDQFVDDVLVRNIDTVYVEQASLSDIDNLSRWLASNGYINDIPVKTGLGGELTYLQEKLLQRGVKVVNMDMASNPTALPFAIQHFGFEKTIKDLNQSLLLKSWGPAAQLDQNKIPEIITRLINEAGGNINQARVRFLVEGRGLDLVDLFTDAEREAYMLSVITGEKYGVAAHTGHTSAIAEKLFGTQKLDDLTLYVDGNKVSRVINEQPGNTQLPVPKTFLEKTRDTVSGIFDRSATVTVAGEKRQITTSLLRSMDREQRIALFEQVLENGDLKEMKKLSQMMTKAQGKDPHQIDVVVGGEATGKYLERLAKTYPAEIPKSLRDSLQKRTAQWERKLADRYGIEANLLEDLEDQIRFINKVGTSLLPFSYAGGFAHGGKVYMLDKSGQTLFRNPEITFLHEWMHTRVQKALGIYTSSGRFPELEGFFEGSIEWAIAKIDPKSRYVLTSQFTAPAYFVYRYEIDEVVKRLNAAGVDGEKMMMEFFVSGDPNPIFKAIGQETIEEIFAQLLPPLVINARYLGETASIGLASILGIGPVPTMGNIIDTFNRIINSWPF